MQILSVILCLLMFKFVAIVNTVDRLGLLCALCFIGEVIRPRYFLNLNIFSTQQNTDITNHQLLTGSRTHLGLLNNLRTIIEK